MCGAAAEEHRRRIALFLNVFVSARAGLGLPAQTSKHIACFLVLSRDKLWGPCALLRKAATKRDKRIKIQHTLVVSLGEAGEIYERLSRKGPKGIHDVSQASRWVILCFCQTTQPLRVRKAPTDLPPRSWMPCVLVLMMSFGPVAKCYFLLECRRRQRWRHRGTPVDTRQVRKNTEKRGKRALT